MKINARCMRLTAWLVFCLPLGGDAALSAPQSVATPTPANPTPEEVQDAGPIPSTLPVLGLSPIIMGPEPVGPSGLGTIDDVTPAQLFGATTAPGPAAPTGAPAAATTPATSATPPRPAAARGVPMPSGASSTREGLRPPRPRAARWPSTRSATRGSSASFPRGTGGRPSRSPAISR